MLDDQQTIQSMFYHYFDASGNFIPYINIVYKYAVAILIIEGDYIPVSFYYIIKVHIYRPVFPGRSQ